MLVGAKLLAGWLLFTWLETSAYFTLLSQECKPRHQVPASQQLQPSIIVGPTNKRRKLIWLNFFSFSFSCYSFPALMRGQSGLYASRKVGICFARLPFRELHQLSVSLFPFCCLNNNKVVARPKQQVCFQLAAAADAAWDLSQASAACISGGSGRCLRWSS